jgi:hypothetical protein
MSAMTIQASTLVSPKLTAREEAPFGWHAFVPVAEHPVNVLVEAVEGSETVDEYVCEEVDDDAEVEASSAAEEDPVIKVAVFE